MSLPYPRNGYQIHQARLNGSRPAGPLLVALHPCPNWDNATVYASPERTYRWDWIRGLPNVVVLIGEKTRIGSILADIFNAEPAQLDVVDLERRMGVDGAVRPSEADHDALAAILGSELDRHRRLLDGAGGVMEYIPDTVDLNEYMEAPEFAAKVRSASEFANAVKAKMQPEEARKRAPSMLLGKLRGIEFRPGEVTAWVGYNGHRKSMFTSQVALDLCVQRQRTLIASLEMDPADTMHRMTRQAAGRAIPAISAIDHFHHWTDKRLWVFDHVGELSTEHAMALCRYFSATHAGTQVLLDSMMMICASEERLDEQKRFSTGVVRIAQETGLHIHVITHCRKPQHGGEDRMPSRYEIRGSSAISDQAHNVMVVWMNKKKFERLEADPHDGAAAEEPCAVVKCDKQRNGRWEGKVKLWHHEDSLRFCEDRTSPVEPYRLFSEASFGE